VVFIISFELLKSGLDPGIKTKTKSPKIFVFGLLVFVLFRWTYIVHPTHLEPVLSGINP